MGRIWIEKCCFQVGRVLEGDVNIHDIFEAVIGPVYMTQRMQVEDQWEIKLRRQWGPGRLIASFINICWAPGS